MQQVTNCIVIDQNQLLVLKKPKHGWYAIPGGKMEFGETIRESVIREYKEETGLQLHDPRLAGVFTFTVLDEDESKREWMMYTFICHKYSGKLVEFCREGELEWIDIKKIKNLPMAEGDRMIYQYIFNSDHVVTGTFNYTKADELISYRIDPL